MHNKRFYIEAELCQERKAQENVCEQGNGEEITFQYSQRENCFIISYS